MNELVKFTLPTRDVALCFMDRYSEDTSAAAAFDSQLLQADGISGKALIKSEGMGRSRASALRLATVPMLTQQTGTSPSLRPHRLCSLGEDIACPLVRPAP